MLRKLLCELFVEKWAFLRFLSLWVSYPIIISGFFPWQKGALWELFKETFP
jgi:hypothetical protein